ncbi:MAG: ATP-binding protein [Planctomycetes bacterium]|nr:ATP-binding protein [Planctomycetota bacterium]
MQIKTTDRITVAGTPDTGKTIFVKALLRSIPARIRVFDPLGQYGEFDNIVPRSSGQFVEVCREVWDQGNTFFVIEESELYLPNIPLSGVDDHIARLILQGRNRGIGIMAVTHSLSDFSKPFFKACKNVFIFTLFSPNDIKYLRGFMGPEADQIRNLPPYHFAHFSQGTTTLCAPIPFP